MHELDLAYKSCGAELSMSKTTFGSGSFLYLNIDMISGIEIRKTGATALAAVAANAGGCLGPLDDTERCIAGIAAAMQEILVDIPPSPPLKMRLLGGDIFNFWKRCKSMNIRDS